MEQIADAHKKNMFLWSVILIGMLALTAVVYYLDTEAIFRPLPDGRQYGQIFFIIAIILAGAILLLKRSLFVPEKVVGRLPKTGAKPEQIIILLSRMRFNYLIIWSLAESILVAGFISYILLVEFNNFLIFAIVAVYSLIINIPSENALHRAVSLLEMRG